MNVTCIGQSASLRHTMHDIAHMAIVIINVITLRAIPIMITTMNINQQKFLTSNAPLATGKMTIATISQKEQATRSIRATARYRGPSTPSWTNRQSIRGLSAWRSRPIKRSRPCKVQWMRTTPQMTIATSAMTTAVQWTPTTRKLRTTTTEALTAAQPATTMTTLPPFWLLLSLSTRTIAASSSDINKEEMAYAQSTSSSTKGLQEPFVISSNTN
jgi:hypothetical protein